jgi:hypothetical protein
VSDRAAVVVSFWATTEPASDFVDVAGAVFSGEDCALLLVSVTLSDEVDAGRSPESLEDLGAAAVSAPVDGTSARADPLSTGCCAPSSVAEDDAFVGMDCWGSDGCVSMLWPVLGEIRVPSAGAESVPEAPPSRLAAVSDTLGVGPETAATPATSALTANREHAAYRTRA